MDTFKDFYSTNTDSSRKKRHNGAFDLQPFNRKSTNFVPVCHQTKHENPKFKRVKDGKSTKEFLRKDEVAKLQRMFGFKLGSSDPIGLGNTGIKLIKQPGGWIITKNV